MGVRVVLVIALGKHGTGATARGGVDIDVEGLIVVGPCESRDCGEGMFRELKGRAHLQGIHELEHWCILGLAGVERREDAVEMRYEAMVEANHAGITGGSCRPSGAHVFVDHVEDRLRLLWSGSGTVSSNIKTQVRH